MELFEAVASGRIEHLLQNAYDSLPDLAACRLPVAVSIDFLNFLCSNTNESSVDQEEIEALYPICESTQDFFELRENAYDADIEMEFLTPLLGLADQATFRRLIRQWVNLKQAQRLKQISGLVAMAGGDALTHVARCPLSGYEQWLQSHPVELHEGLTQLAYVSQRPVEVAQKVLASDFPDPAKQQRELEYLESAIEQKNVDLPRRQALSDRASALRQQMARQSARTRTVPSGRLGNLNRKLLKRAMLECENTLIENLQQYLRRQFPQDLGEIAVQQLARPDVCAVAVGVHQLKGEMRNFGIQLLELSFAGRSFPEMECPANRDYIKKIEAAGVKVEPWMDLSQMTSSAVKDAQPTTLSFAMDPLDYLLMGHHFQTCLAPGSFNFFSAIANAIDVNKRVIYARDELGNVAGRCLVALTDEGKLVRFHAYSHQAPKEFGTMIDGYLGQLADQMKTQLGGRRDGVPSLVAQRWYDDGIVRTETKAPLDLLRDALASDEGGIVDGRASAELAAALNLAIEETDAQTLIEELEKLPDWSWAVEVCLARACAARQSDSNGNYASEMLFEKCAQETLVEAVRKVSVRKLERLFRRSSCDHSDCFAFHGIGNLRNVSAFIDAVTPSVGLRLLRVSRKEQIKQDLQETNSDRRELLAVCHLRLGRDALVRKLRTSI